MIKPIKHRMNVLYIYIDPVTFNVTQLQPESTITIEKDTVPLIAYVCIAML